MPSNLRNTILMLATVKKKEEENEKDGENEVCNESSFYVDIEKLLHDVGIDEY